MSRLTDTLRLHLLATITGQKEGRPAWMDRLEHGEDAGFFGPGSAAWAVHGGIPSMVAGIRALLMQSLHPGALAGVHDWSRYREDPLGRLAGTVQWLVTVTFGDTELARTESERVGRFHERVRGSYVDSAGADRPYAAGDPDLLSWVHIVFTDSFLACHRAWGAEIPGGADRYIREWATAGELVGVPDPPRSETQLRRQLQAFDHELKSDDRVAETVRFLRNPPLRRSLRPAYRILFAGAVASIPQEYRARLGLRRSALPVIWATGVVLNATSIVLRGAPTSEQLALRRIARLEEPALA